MTMAAALIVGKYEENDMIEADFRCSLVITNGDEDTDTETKVLIFKRHINIEISVKDEEDKLIEVLEKLLVGKKCKATIIKMAMTTK